MTSRWESFGLVIPEAMYFENFVISADFDSAYELLAHGRYGEIIQVDDVVGLQQKLKELIVHEEKYVGKAKDGSVWIRKNFLWENIVKDIYKMLGEKL
nr:CAZy families GT4 protein [uncultured Clostridium sp.]